MGKHRVDKMEEIYQDLEKRFGGMTDEELQTAISEDASNLGQNEEAKHEAEALRDTVNKKKQLISVLEGRNDGNSPRIQKAIEDAQAELEEAEKKLEEREKGISSAEKSKVNAKAYRQNRAQIRKIRTFKESLQRQLEAEIVKRDDGKTKMEAAEESLKDANKKLADEKLTMEMDQYEYNALLEQKAQAEKDVKEQTEIYKKAKEKILDIQTKIGKCNLAWRTLFAGKTWDDIQRRALDPNTKFVRHIEEEKDTQMPSPSNNGKRSPEEKMKKDIADTVDAVKAEQRANGTSGKKADLPVPAPKHPRWEKFKNFFKNARHKLKEIFVGEDGKKEPDYSKMKEIPVEKRDQFLEELRRNVDKEYGKKVREERESNYIEQHKAKPKTAEPQEKDAR